MEGMEELEGIYSNFAMKLDELPNFVGKEEITSKLMTDLTRKIEDVRQSIDTSSNKTINSIIKSQDTKLSKELTTAMKDIKYELKETQKSYLEKIKNSMDIPITSTLEKEALDDINNSLIKYMSVYESLPDFVGKQGMKETHIKELSKSMNEMRKSIRTETEKRIGKLEKEGIVEKSPLGKLTSMFSKAGAILMAIDLSFKFIKWSVDKILNNKFSGYMKASLSLWDSAINLAFKPMADAIGMFLIPVLLKMMKFFTSKGYVENIVPALQGLLDFVVGLGTFDASKITGGLSKVWESTYKDGGLMDTLINILVPESENKKLRATLQKVRKSMEWVTNATVWVLELITGQDLEGKWEDITKWINSALNWLKDKLVDGLKWVGNKAIDLLKYIVGNLKILSADFIDAIVDSSLFETIAGSIYKGLLYIPNTFLEVIAQIADKVPTVMSSLGSGLFSLINTVIDWLPSIAEKAFGTEAGDWVRSKTEKYKVSDEFIASLSEDPAQAIRDLKVSADEMDFSFDNAVSGIKAWTSQLRDSGRAILDYTDATESYTDATESAYGAQWESTKATLYGSGERTGYSWVETSGGSYGWASDESLASGGGLRGRAVGGRIPSDGVYYLHAGENVQTVNQVKSGGGTVDTINVKISAQGMTSVDNTMANKIANQTVTQLMANQTIRSGVRLNASRG
jgi:hypothetical protein